VNGRLIQGMGSIMKDCLELVGPMDTQHMLGAIRVDVQDGASTARVTAMGQNQHFRAGQGTVAGAPHLLAGVLNECEVVKDGSGQWKMKTWRLKIIWTQGTYDVMKPETSK
jgi:hypothetical protein